MKNKKEKIYFSVFFLTVLLSLLSFLQIALANFTDNDNTAGEFGGGTTDDIEWNAENNWLELDPTGLTNGTGIFTSRIMDAGADSIWRTISWVPNFPSYKELPDDGQSEVLYSNGNANMSGNILLFHFNELDGATTFFDTSGNDNDASCAGDTCPLVTSTGKFSRALQFDGNDDSIDLAAQPVSSIFADEFSISFWANPGALDDKPSFGFSGSGGANIDNPISSYDGALSIGDGLLTQFLPVLPDAPANTWTHYVIVDNGSNYLVYVNGSLVDSTVIAVDPGAAIDRVFTLGRSGFGGGFSDNFNGSYDEFAIFSRDLTAQEVVYLYKRGGVVLKHQIRSCDDAACVGDTFIGPDGSADTYFSEMTTTTLALPSKDISSVTSFERYFQYQTTFETVSTTVSPLLQSVTILNDVPGVTLTPSSTTTTISEVGSTSDTYTVVLDSEPTDDVIITASFDNELFTLSTSSIIFTTENWDTPVTVTITAVDDDVEEGTVSSTITHVASSTDIYYDEIDIDDVLVYVEDNDIAGFTVSAISGNTTEAGATATFTVVLLSEPIATVSTTITSNDITEGSVSTNEIVFTPLNWDTPQTITVTGVDDDIDDGNIGYTILLSIASSTDENYQINPADVAVTNTDNDVAGIDLSAISGNTTEAGVTSTATVVLETEPTADVVIVVESSDTTEGTVLPTRLTFTSLDWDQEQTITVSGVDDAVVDGNTIFSITFTVSSTDIGYDDMDVGALSLSNIDNDTEQPEQTAGGGWFPPPAISLISNNTKGTVSSTQEFTFVTDIPVPIRIAGEAHSLQKIAASDRRAIFILRSAPILVTIEKNQILQFDVTNDGIDDVQIEYAGLVANQPKVVIKDLSGLINKQSGMYINNGQYQTKNPIVTIHFDFTDNVSFMAVSDRPDFEDAIYEPYRATTSWKLTLPYGEKTIYARLRNASGASVDVHASITYVDSMKKTFHDGGLIKLSEDPRVFIIINGRKQWISTEKVFREAGYKFRDIEIISDTEFYGIETGSVINQIGDIPTALRKQSATSTPSFTRFLREGMSGKDILLLQETLGRLGYFSHTTTGYFGEITKEAVRAFQQSNGIDPLGYVGPSTREALNRL